MAVEAKEVLWWAGLSLFLVPSRQSISPRTQALAAHRERWNRSGKEIPIFCMT